MYILFLLLFLNFFSNVAKADVNECVVKIFVTSNSVDYYQPWQTRGSRPKTGSGCIIKGNRILTNAHVVADHTFIQVRKFSDPKKYTAKLEAIGHDCDLALLSVDDPTFFNGIIPPELGALPSLTETVTVIGYPSGGDKLSITEGVISRIEVIPYSHSSLHLLAVQIDAAVNPGNSGGPVIKDGKLVGVAMQVIQNRQNIGYIIPPPIIEHFFEDIKDKEYDGFPQLGMELNNTENSTLRAFYKIEDKKGGVLVSKVLPNSAADAYMQENDIIMHINDVPIEVDGTFTFRNNERLFMSHLVTEKQIGEEINLGVIRGGKEKTLKIKLKKFKQLVSNPRFYQKPSYYIFGGLVFTTLSVDLLMAWGEDWPRGSPLDFNYYRFGCGRLNDKRRKDLVVLLDVLPDDINIGYHGNRNEIVSKVNGKEIGSFQDFVTVLTQKKGKFTIIETENNSRIILDNKNLNEANKDILKRNNIPQQFSDDVAEWLDQKK